MNSTAPHDAIGGYEPFFGLHEPPFSLAPDPRFLFSSQSHSAALAQVGYALSRREPLVVITGEIGTGKTLLCRTVLQRFVRKTFVSVVNDPLLDRDEFLTQLLDDFGVISKDRTTLARASRHDLVDALEGFLRSLAPLQAHAVVIVDEAQHLQPDVIEQIRLLSNVDDRRGTLLQIVLVGQSELDVLLARPELRQMQQRVSRRFRLEPLTRDEVRQYIEHRLTLARKPSMTMPGASELARELAEWNGNEDEGVAFAPEAIDAIHQLSGGLPRVVNLLCDRALEEAYRSRVRRIDVSIVKTAADAVGSVRRLRPVPALESLAMAATNVVPMRPPTPPAPAVELSAAAVPEPAVDMAPPAASLPTPLRFEPATPPSPSAVPLVAEGPAPDAAIEPGAAITPAAPVETPPPPATTMPAAAADVTPPPPVPPVGEASALDAAMPLATAIPVAPAAVTPPPAWDSEATFWSGGRATLTRPPAADSLGERIPAAFDARTRARAGLSRQSPVALALGAFLAVAAIAFWFGLQSTSEPIAPRPAPAAASAAAPPPQTPQTPTSAPRADASSFSANPPAGGSSASAPASSLRAPATPPSAAPPSTAAARPPGAPATATPASSTPPPTASAPTTARPPGMQGSAPAAAAAAGDAAANRLDIVVASFRTSARATEVAADIVALGLPARQRAADGWQQVVSGPFASRSDAEAAQQRLQGAGFGGTRIVPADR